MGILKYGMMTNPSKDIIKEILKVRRLGFDYVELAVEIPEAHHDILRKRRKEILRELSRFRHGPVSHTTWQFDLTSDYEEVRQAWLSVAKSSIDVSAMLGCRLMNIHAPILQMFYAQYRRYMKKALDNYVKSMRELVRYASGKGVVIVLENLPTPDTVTLKEYTDIMNRVPGLKAHIDIGHCFMEGGMGMISRYLRTFQDRLEHVHVSDNMGDEDEHLGIFQGAIDYIRVMRLLKKVGYDKGVTLEVHSTSKDLKDSLRILRAIEEEVW